MEKPGRKLSRLFLEAGNHGSKFQDCMLYWGHTIWKAKRRSFMKKKYVGAALTMGLFLLIATAACGGEEAEDTGNARSVQEEASAESSESGQNIFGEFEAQTLEGDKVTQEIFGQSKLTMINIWGTFCGPCIQEMPELGEIGRSYDSSEFQVIGLISDVTEPGDSKAEEIVQSTQADYVHLTASADLQKNVLSYVSVVPTTVFVDSDGNQVGKSYAGARSGAEWTQIIEDLRNEAGE